MEKCKNWEQNCHLVSNEIAKDCADAKGVICPNFDEWKYYPDSPWGDIDICPHGCIRLHGSTKPECRFCDENKCPKCGSTNLSGFNIVSTYPLLMCLDCGYGKDEEWKNENAFL